MATLVAFLGARGCLWRTGSRSVHRRHLLGRPKPQHPGVDGTSGGCVIIAAVPLDPATLDSQTPRTLDGRSYPDHLRAPSRPSSASAQRQPRPPAGVAPDLADALLRPRVEQPRTAARAARGGRPARLRRRARPRKPSGGDATSGVRLRAPCRGEPRRPTVVRDVFPQLHRLSCGPSVASELVGTP